MGREEFSRPLPGEQHLTIGTLQSRIHTVDPLPREAHTETTGTGDVDPSDDRTTLSVGDTGDEATLVHGALPHKYTSGRVLFELVWQVNQPLSDIVNHMFVGSVQSGLASANQNIVAFRPGVGNNTEGNIVVNPEGESEVNGTFEYPETTDSAHYYAIMMDFNNDETRFHVDSNPYVSRGTVIDSVPDRVSHPGARMEYGGSSFEQLSINTIGYRYIP